MTDLSFSNCPLCGEVEAFELHTDERIYGSSTLQLEVNEDGSLKQVDSLNTEIGWSTAKVVGYYASCCGETLPDVYCDEIDRVMEVERERTE